MTDQQHVSVLLKESVEALQTDPAGRIVDATYGRGGHSQALLDRLNDSGRLLALDRDPDAVADARQRFRDEPRFAVEQANFADLTHVLDAHGWTGKVTGLLLDLGVSSPQLDEAERGFGFSRDGQLDMRMDPHRGVSAAEWLSTVGETELVHVLKTYGEERYAKRIARAILAARDSAPLLRTAQLADIVKTAHPRWERHHHPATRTFQAIRIQVNDELGAVERVLSAAADVLAVGGRLAVISFHSLEDRIVKRALRPAPPDPRIPRHLPQPQSTPHPWRSVGKPVRASDDEVSRNPRSRSATLRIAERVAA